MKKRMVILLFAGILGFSLAGCQGGSSKDSQEPADQKEEAEIVAEDAGDDFDEEEWDDEAIADETEIYVIGEDGELYETEVPLDPITPSDYLVKDAADYVKLGDCEGISVEQADYEITEDMIQERIDEELEMYAQEVEQDRASEPDDTVYADLSYVVEETDETYEEEDFFTTVGSGEFGEEFDQKLTGVSKGDKLEFSISYDEEDEMMEWAGQTVDFTLDITGVYTLEVPEYNEEYVTNIVGFTSMEEYEDYIRESLTEEYDDIGYTEAMDTLFDEAYGRAEFDGYPEDLYEACKEETVAFYSSFSGADSLDEVYEMFGITEEDVDEEIRENVNQRLFISAYCLANDIEVTEDEYVAYLEDNAISYGEPNAASFEAIYGRDSLVWTLYELKTTEDLYEKANVTRVVASETEDDMMDMEEDLEEDTEMYSEAEE